MEFLNIGTGELLFLVLLAILVIGPRRTVELSRQVGRLVGRLQGEWRNVQRDLMAEVRSLEEDVASQVREPAPSTAQGPTESELDEEEIE